MALTKCPECSQSVSTEAISCPHCGYSLMHTERMEPPFVDMKSYVRLRRREEQLSRETYDPFLGKELNSEWGYVAVIILILVSIGWFLTFSGKAIADYKRVSALSKQSSSAKNSGVVLGFMQGRGVFGSMVGKSIHSPFNWKKHLALIFIPPLFGAGFAYLLWLRWRLVDKKLQERDEIRKNVG